MRVMDRDCPECVEFTSMIMCKIKINTSGAKVNLNEQHPEVKGNV